jgi:hypothetical protein
MNLNIKIVIFLLEDIDKVKGWFGKGDYPITQKANFNRFDINLTAVCSLDGIHGLVIKREKFGEDFIITFLLDSISKFRIDFSYSGPIIVFLFV